MSAAGDCSRSCVTLAYVGLVGNWKGRAEAGGSVAKGKLLTKIYTRTGDAGMTMLGDGVRVPKDDLRVEAYGTVDEANATIGLAVSGLADAGPRSEELRVLLTTIQNDMFDVGADLCRPVAQDEAQGARLRITDAHVKVLEEAIDLHNARLESLDSFVLPGGSEAAARLHVARTVVRRAERLVTTLLDRQPGTTNDAALRYLNRLSDLLFVLGRVANDDGRKDVKWVPGRQLGR